MNTIRIVSLSVTYGSNITEVHFKTFQTLGALERLTGEYTAKLEGRFEHFDDPDLLAQLTNLIENV